MSKAKPLTAEQCEAAREAMLTGHSLSKISRCAGVVATIEYMLKDIRLLETYLQRMASAITQKREQISHSALLLSMFHYEMSSLSLYDPAFKEMLLKAVEQERIIQRKLFVAGNSTEVTPYRDVWKLYEPYGNVLRLKRLDFTAIKRPSLRSEVKYYFCYLFEQRGKVYVPLFDACKLAINTLADIAPEVIYFADITEGHIRTLVLALEAMRKNDGEPLSQYYIAKSVNGLKRIMCYLMSTERDTQIRAPRPRTNPFDIVTFHNLRQFNTPTEIIPRGQAQQNRQSTIHAPETTAHHFHIQQISDKRPSRYSRTDRRTSLQNKHTIPHGFRSRTKTNTARRPHCRPVKAPR